METIIDQGYCHITPKFEVIIPKNLFYSFLYNLVEVHMKEIAQQMT